jgi:hypothetical protein
MAMSKNTIITSAVLALLLSYSLEPVKSFPPPESNRNGVLSKPTNTASKSLSSNDALRTCSISEIQLNPTIRGGGFDTVCTGRLSDVQLERASKWLRRLRYLRRPNEFKSVAIVELLPNGSVLLNPRHAFGGPGGDTLMSPEEGSPIDLRRLWPAATKVMNSEDPDRIWRLDYGPIPLLSDISYAQAERLWGSDSESKSVKTNSRTYRLKTFNNDKDPDFFLDLVFENDRIQKYRIRSTDLPDTNWHASAQTKEDGSKIHPPQNFSYLKVSSRT